MSSPNTIAQTRRTFPVRPLLDEARPVLVRFSEDHPVVADADVHIQRPSDDVILLRQEFVFLGLSPLQAKEEAEKEFSRRLWMSVMDEAADALDSISSRSHRSTSTISAMRAVRLHQGARWANRGIWRAGAWGMLLSGLIAIATAAFAYWGAQLRPIAWTIGVLSACLGLFSALVAWRSARAGAHLQRNPTLIGQSLAAVELASLFREIETSVPSPADIDRDWGESPLSGSQMRAIDERLARSTENAYWIYRSLVQNAVDVVAHSGTPRFEGAAQAHLAELKALEAEFGSGDSDAATAVGGIFAESISSRREESQASGGFDRALTCLTALVLSVLIGVVQLSIPSLIVASAQCGFATAEVRIAHCPDLIGISAAGASLSGVDLGGKDLTDADFREAVLESADFGSAMLARATFAGARMSNASLLNADLAGALLPSADLTGANLKGADLTGADLTGANLTNADLSEANLSGADLTGAKVEGANFTGVNFTGADLSREDVTKSRIKDANFNGAILDEADFSGMDVGGMSFKDAQLKGANLARTILVDGDLSGADLSGATLIGLRLSGANLAGISVEQLVTGGADLAGALLLGADFNGVSGTKVTLKSANMDGVDLSGLDLREATLDGSSLSGADLSESNLIGASLKGVDLSDANLAVADASGAVFTGSDLSRSDLSDLRALKANFQKVNFSGSTLDGADFSGSDLTGAVGLGSTARRAQWLATTCPDGRRSEICG